MNVHSFICSENDYFMCKIKSHLETHSVSYTSSEKQEVTKSYSFHLLLRSADEKVITFYYDFFPLVTKFKELTAPAGFISSLR